jgi:UDP-N-acetylglucosamine 2-epimerase (non-hydrolysing)
MGESTTTAPAEVTHLEPGSVAIVFGTRPEIVKLSGIIELLGPAASTVFSGQHFDPLLSKIFFDELRLPPPDAVLTVGGQTRAHQIGELVLRLEEHLLAPPRKVVVVQGDTNTTLGGALAANAAGIPLVHVEAGLRSFDRRMPEEHNRIVVDHLADLCLAPTTTARDNLLAEGIPDGRIVVTGNTVIDAASRLMPAPDERAALLYRMGLASGEFALATFHRPENVDDPRRLAALLDHLTALGLRVVFPVHPRTAQSIASFRLDRSAGHVKTIPPLGYPAFLALAAESAFLVSDSGGVQEEATVVKRPALIVRRSTDRPEVTGTFATLLDSPADLPAAASKLLADLGDIHSRLAAMPSPYGDGHASRRCVRHIVSMANGGTSASSSG